MEIRSWLRPSLFCLVFVIGSGLALAEVADRSDVGFTIKYSIAIQASPEQAFSKIVDISKWWDSAHTYSGDARNLSLEAKAGGCFCERLPKGGGVEHMRVVYLVPGRSLRMLGGLGPLQANGVSGSLSIELAKGTLTLVYRVGGYVPGGIQSMIAPVDIVLGQQFKRLTNLIERDSATLEQKN